MDEPSPCPYLDGLTARMPLQYPQQAVEPEQLDDLLANGYRRSGWFYYRTACPTCNECRPLRVDVRRFAWTKSLKRVLKRGDAELRVECREPSSDEQRVQLFNLHRNARDMSRDDADTDAAGYEAFLCNSFNTTFELSYHVGDRLIAVAITDVGAESLSAVYCFFDPEFDHLSLGTYSILKQIQIAERNEMEWLYLGMYVAGNRHLKYKARYYPHERFCEGRWQRFEREGD